MDVRGKVALVTGSARARGFGKAFAVGLLQRGAKDLIFYKTVVLTDILEEAGRSTEAELKAQYGADHVAFFLGDITKSADMELVFENALKTFGRLDILINSAGVGGDRPYQLTFDVNVFGTFRCCELAVERMRTDKGGPGGVIINIGSYTGLYCRDAYPYYHASKHAVVGYTGSYAKRLENQNTGVRMVVLCPNSVKTDLSVNTQRLEASGDPQTVEYIQRCGGWTPISTVVEACMRLIESEVPAGSIVRADNLVLGIAEREQMPFSPLP